ncbi:hypothetical protein [Vibrio kyushuensis]|uniref:hypothetical protein n=1 Tax=Vibrio kyushuensis TaxID=2910249 RepID=UPI003D0A5E70
MKMKKIYLAALPLTLCMNQAVATEGEEVQDMSNPLAVYTQGGIGFSNKGVNLKVGATYTTGVDTEMGMNILEIKGFAGDILGWDGSSKRNDTVDSIRYRDFVVDLTNGRGTQLDIAYSTSSDANGGAAETGTASYSMIQALPALGPVSFFPLAGAGLMFGNNLDEKGLTNSNGYSIPGAFGVVGMYTKITVTDKIWLNFNPMYMQTLSGSDMFKDYAFAGDDSILTHEFTASYQIQPRFNVRYFANWNEHVDFADGDHRVEFNYQF